MRDGSHTLGYGVIAEICTDLDIEEVEEGRKAAKKAARKAAEAEN